MLARRVDHPNALSLNLAFAGLVRFLRRDDALGALGLGAARAQEQGQDYHDAELHLTCFPFLGPKLVRKKLEFSSFRSRTRRVGNAASGNPRLSWMRQNQWQRL